MYVLTKDKQPLFVSDNVETMRMKMSSMILLDMFTHELTTDNLRIRPDNADVYLARGAVIRYDITPVSSI